MAKKTEQICSECVLENVEILKRLIELVEEQILADSPFGETFVALGAEISLRSEGIIEYGNGLSD